MSLETTHELPIPVKEAYEISEQSTVTRVNGGLVNETLLVELEDRSLILRKLAPILGSHTIRTIFEVGGHLISHNWEAPAIEPTVTGELFVRDESEKMWHAMPYISSDCAIPADVNPMLAQNVGELLGSWHDTVSTLDFKPESLPHFHDIDYIAKKLSAEAELLPSNDFLELARDLLNDYSQQNDVTPGATQIIHGDPKLDNMLYRDKRPFTLIDFDCVMIDTVWTDIGDFLRSLSGKLVGTGQSPIKAIDSFLNGYLATTVQEIDPDEARYHALQATRRVACELGMRYLSDIVDGQHYFAWDPTRFSTRTDALFSKAQTQHQILQITRNYLNEGAY